jgi:type IV fimbrial biogenesis protein FimT
MEGDVMHQQGFSLIELLMGLTIVGIVLHLISPALATLTESTRREEAARSIIGGIRSARALAITHHQTVVIHGIDGDWGRGWRIIFDLSGKGADDPDNPQVTEHASAADLPIVGNWWIRRHIRFDRLGMPQAPTKAFKGGTLHLCDAREPMSQLQVVLAPSGRTSLRSDKAEQTVCEK